MEESRTGKMGLKILLFFVIPAVVIIAAGAGYKLLRHVYSQVTYTAGVYDESTAAVQNPFHGFYHLYGYALTEEGTESAASLADTISGDTKHSLALLEVNLNQFRNTSIPHNALLQLDTLLSCCEKSGRKLLLRFLYDWDGKSSETEPDSLERILSHVEQVAPYVNSHKQAVYIMQGIFAGDCGEMHGSIYTDDAGMIAIIKHLDKMIDREIFLGVRTPSHYRTINDRFTPIGQDEAFTGELASRLSLFNDGMLGSYLDLGTYGDSTFANAKNPKDKGTREEEIDFQDKLCRYVPNGGECVLDNEYNDFENAVKDLAAMHVSYLNTDYDGAVLDKWKKSTYSGDDIYDGMNGFDYIERHLGYRYHISGSSFDYDRYESPVAYMHITLNNSGFSPAYKKYDTRIILEHEASEVFTAAPTQKNSISGTNSESVSNTAARTTIILDTDFDNRILSGNSQTDIIIPLNTDTLEDGTYEIYFSMKYTDADGQDTPIILANETYSHESGYVPLGSLNVASDKSP